MKKIVIALSAILAVVSCQSLKEEWQPVFTFGENEPAEFKPATEQDLMARYGFSEFTTIKALKSMYKTPGVEIHRFVRPGGPAHFQGSLCNAASAGRRG